MKKFFREKKSHNCVGGNKYLRNSEDGWKFKLNIRKWEKKFSKPQIHIKKCNNKNEDGECQEKRWNEESKVDEKKSNERQNWVYIGKKICNIFSSANIL